MSLSESSVLTVSTGIGLSEESENRASTNSNFEVVVEKQINNADQFEIPSSGANDEVMEEITPAYYYENMGIPVFTPVRECQKCFLRGPALLC